MPFWAGRHTYRFIRLFPALGSLSKRCNQVLERCAWERVLGVESLHGLNVPHQGLKRSPLLPKSIRPD